MKSPLTSKINPSIFKQDQGEQPVRVIKAAQAGKILGTTHHNHAETNGAAEASKKPTIRMIQTGVDYCDIEVTCGCGETTQVRCWNTPPTGN